MEPAEWVWLGALIGLGVADIILAKRDKKLLSDSAREHKTVAAAIIALFIAHLVDALGPIDPFRRLGRWLG